MRIHDLIYYPMNDDNQLTDLSKRLGVVIALLARCTPKPKDSLSLREQIQLLSELQLRPRDIADILGRTQTYVNKELAGIRKAKGKSK